MGRDGDQMSKCDFRRGSDPDPTGGIYSAPPHFLAVFMGVYF